MTVTVPAPGAGSRGARRDPDAPGGPPRDARRAERAAEKARREAGRARLLRVARAFVRHLPLPVASALGQAFGGLVWWAVPWLRRQTLRNLEIALGAEMDESARRAIARRCFALAGRGLFAWMVVHRMGKERALALVSYEPSPEALEVLRSGQGHIVLTQHAGLWDLAGARITQETGLAGVGREAEDAATSLLIEMRREIGVRTIEHGGAREIVRILKHGGSVAMLADQDMRGVNGAFVPFFGRPAHTPVGPATMAVRLGVPIVCFVAEWRSFTTHAARLTEVLRPRADLPDDEAVLELTARCSAAIERAVRRRPAEWMWIHDRWRTSPADRPEAVVWPRPGEAARP